MEGIPLTSKNANKKKVFEGTQTKNANKKKIFETKNVSHFLSSQAFFEVKATTTGLHFLFVSLQKPFFLFTFFVSNSIFVLEKGGVFFCFTQ